jgi:hypothetical protein
MLNLQNAVETAAANFMTLKFEENAVVVEVELFSKLETVTAENSCEGFIAAIAEMQAKIEAAK